MLYSNRRSLGATAFLANLSPQWQREMALRSVLWGKDKKHEKLWIYADRKILDADMPMSLMLPINAIRTACEIVVNGGRVFVSPSVVPHSISQAYEIDVFPDWLVSCGCLATGDSQDAAHILEVLKIFGRLHNVKPLGNYEISVTQHGRNAIGNPLYIPHILPKESRANVKYIQRALEILGVK